MKREIIFATNNAHKLGEIRSMLQDSFHIVSLAETGCRDDIPETEPTIEGNALCKARYVHDRFAADCFADDTGLEVEALGGAPGVCTARFGALNGFGDDHDAEGNTRCLLHMMEGLPCRKARFRTVIALIDSDGEHLFEGIVNGEITAGKRGEKGFGYDPVFVPEGFSETFAEMGTEMKNKISHRAKAVAKLADYLKKKKKE